MRSTRDSSLILGATFVLGLATVTACASLKNADAPDPGDGGTSGGPGGNVEAGGGTGIDGGASSNDAGTSGSSGTSGTSGSSGGKNGDPRWPQWPMPSDAPAASSYTVMNGADGAIIVDNVTKLAWQDAFNASSLSLDDATTYCNGLTYDAQTDWRLPTRIEALSIMSIGTTFDSSSVVGAPFSPPTSVSQCFWTSSRISGSTQSAYSVNGAGMGSYLTSDGCAVRCVRGGPAFGAAIAKSFVATTDTVSDPTTGLVWEKTPPSTAGTLADADSRCKALTLGGKVMRLPGVKELASIVDETKSEPAQSGVFGSYSARMFTSNPQWTVNFDDGTSVQGPSGFMYYSRCVSGP